MVYTNNYNTNNAQVLDNLPPCNLDAEEQLLGTILCTPSSLELVKHLETEVFVLTAHQKIWRCFKQLDKEGKPANLMQVRNWLEEKKQLQPVGGVAKLAQLAERVTIVESIEDYANILLEKWFRRRLVDFGQKLTQSAYESPASADSLLDSLEEQFSELTESPLRGEKVDPDWAKYQRLLEVVRKCEVECHDPGYKAYTMQAIAKEYGRSPKQIEDIYFKHLIHTEQEPLMSLSELIEKYGSEVREWLMHGFIPKGSTILLHAPGGKGKTRLAYNFFYHLATGSNWDGFPVTAPQRKCMIIQTDEPGYDMVQAVRDRGFEDEMPVLYRTKWQTDHMAYLREEIAEHRPDIVLIDSLSSINRNSVFTENDAEYARPILLLRDIAQEFECTFMIVHHSSKNGDARGTGAIFNSVSEVWKLEDDPDNTAPDSEDRIFTIEKSRTRRPARYKLKFNPDDKSWSCLGEYDHIKNIEDKPEVEASLNMRDRVCQFLIKNAPTRYECEEITHEIGGSLGAVRRACGELSADGVISVNASLQDRRKKIYWVGIESDHQSDHRSDQQSDPIASDQEPIGSDDQKFSPNNGASERSDHLISKTDQKSDQSDQQKSDHKRSDDQHFTESPPEKESGSDQRSDQRSDQADQIRSGDRISKPKFKVGDKVMTPWGKKGKVKNVFPQAAGIQYDIELPSGGCCIFQEKQIEPVAKKHKPSKEEMVEALKSLLAEKGEVDEMELACLTGYATYDVQAILDEIGEVVKSHQMGKIWRLKDGQT